LPNPSGRPIAHTERSPTDDRTETDTMTTTIRYIGLAIVAALILAGGPGAWVIAALVVAVGLNVVPDVVLHRRRKKGAEQ
jgi:hypothetical protein